MELVPAICTQCGAQIEVNKATDAGVCPHCGTAFITQKAINNYQTVNNTYNTTNIKAQNVTVNVKNNGFVVEAGYLKKYQGESSTVVIPDSVSIIGKNAFSGLPGLTQITIPSSVTKIEDCAFDIKAKIVWQDNPSITTLGGAFNFYLGDTVTIPNSVTELSEKSFAFCKADIKWQNGSKMTQIGKKAFCGYEGKSVVLPEGITEICAEAFVSCPNLQTITLPSSIIKIGREAFRECKASIKWTTPAAIKMIHGSAFCQYQGASLTIPASVTKLGAFAFYRSTASIVIPRQVASMGEACFSECSGKIRWEDGSTMTEISDKAFKEYTGNSIELPENLTEIGEWAFSDCNFPALTIPASVSSIGLGAFAYWNKKAQTLIFVGDKKTAKMLMKQSRVNKGYGKAKIVFKK